MRTVFSNLIFFAAFIAAMPVIAQKSPPPAPLPKRPTVTVAGTDPFGPRGESERSLAVDPKPTISLCVSNGRVRVNGWDRDEIRALVDGGAVGFKIAEKAPKTAKPTWIFVLGFDPMAATIVAPDECVSGISIELDVPRGTSVNIKGRPDETRVESVGKVKVETISGNIVLRNIASGITATTYEGSVQAESSKGPISLTSTSGGIVALDLSQSETGDGFKARTNGGAISLQAVGHRQVEAGSISGGVFFRGTLQAGGQYTLGTQNGRVQLTLPADSACKLTAWQGVGAFSSELPLTSPVRSGPSTTGLLGKTANECAIYLKTTSGQIRINAEK